MTGLREAFEKLAGELEYDVADAPAKIRALLAAHPAEPAPVVTDEAVEAGAIADYDYPDWDSRDEKTRDHFRRCARRVLEAAVPLLGPRSGVDSSLHTCPGCGVKVVGHERCGDPTRPECRVVLSGNAKMLPTPAGMGSRVEAGKELDRDER